MEYLMELLKKAVYFCSAGVLVIIGRLEVIRTLFIRNNSVLIQNWEFYDGHQ